MDGQEAESQQVMEALVAAVHTELVSLRGEYGRLTVQKFSRYPTLRRVCGGGDLLDAFLTFERELRRLIATGNRDEVAAALSISAPQDTVLARFEEVLGHIESLRGQDRNQRTARRWSDRGLKTLATDLTHMADIRGHFGMEMLTIEIAGTRATGLHLLISHLMTSRSQERAPLVRFWKYQDEEPVEQSAGLTVDLTQVAVPEASNETYRLKRYTIVAELPNGWDETQVDPGDPLYSVSFEGPDAPMRTVAFVDESDLGEGVTLRFTTYRTIATVEIVRRLSHA